MSDDEEPKPQVFTFRGWNYARETWDHYSALVHTEYEKHLDRYIREVEEWREKHGDKR